MKRSLSEKIVNKPCARSWHSMLKLDEKLLFLYGGLSWESNCLGISKINYQTQINCFFISFSSFLGDAWLFNLNNIQWTKIDVAFEPRIWHTTARTNESSAIYVVGGSSGDIYLNPPRFLSHIIKINVAPESLKRFFLFFLLFFIIFYFS